MPKIVDHDRRREELADAALSLLGREGIRGVTTRAVAEEAGWSTGVLAHYFGSSHDLLLAALRRAAELQGRLLREHRAQADATPVERLRLLLESAFPLDDRRVALTRIFLVFYAESAVNNEAREEVGDYLDNWRRLVERTVRAAQDAGEIDPSIDPAILTIDLVGMADGLAVHAALDAQVMARLRSEPRPGATVLSRVLTQYSLPTT